MAGDGCLFWRRRLRYTPGHRGVQPITYVHSNLVSLFPVICISNPDFTFLWTIVESSTFQSLDSQFSVDYGQGSAQGTLGQDKVQMAGFEVEDQAFGSSLFFLQLSLFFQYCLGSAPQA